MIFLMLSRNDGCLLEQELNQISEAKSKVNEEISLN